MEGLSIITAGDVRPNNFPSIFITITIRSHFLFPLYDMTVLLKLIQVPISTKKSSCIVGISFTPCNQLSDSDRPEVLNMQ
jgi:hypothetical protein